MKDKKATAHSGNYGRSKGSGRPKSILADAETFRVTLSTVVFAMALVAVPTVMAVFKQWGWF